jgi:hypothetical protein
VIQKYFRIRVKWHQTVRAKRYEVRRQQKTTEGMTWLPEPPLVLLMFLGGLGRGQEPEKMIQITAANINKHAHKDDLAGGLGRGHEPANQPAGSKVI